MNNRDNTSSSRRAARYKELLESQTSTLRDPAGYTILTEAKEIRAVEEAARTRLAARGQPIEWAEVGIVFEDQYIQVIRDAVEFPNGKRGTYIRIASRSNGAVGAAILPISSAGAGLVRHFRHATRSWHLEVPRGMAETGEAIEATAARELAEETGWRPARVEPLGPVFPDNGILADRVELFLAEVHAPSVATERDEAIASIVIVPIPELERMIAESEITDSFTIAAFARARLRGRV
ncbi:MAG: NUDIX hydrolase [Myxococcales bacterium]|nr:NUDIX hydrolase [Myxococcales bacterium]